MRLRRAAIIPAALRLGSVPSWMQQTAGIRERESDGCACVCESGQRHFACGGGALLSQLSMRRAGPQLTRHARRQLGSGLAPGIGDSHGWNVAPLQARSSNISIPSPGEPARVHDPYWGRRHKRLRGDGALLREPACWPGPNPKDDLQSPGEVEVMINCQAIALNQERKPRTNEREPHVAPRHYGRNLANTYVHSRVCYPPSSDMRLQLSDDRV